MAFNAANYVDPQGKAIPWYSQTANAASPDAAKARAAAGVTSAAPVKSKAEVAAAANPTSVNAGFNAANYVDPQGKAIPWYSQTANAALPDAAKARAAAGVTSAAPIKSKAEVAAAANPSSVNAGFNAANYTNPQGKAIPWYSQTANAASPDAAKARAAAGVTSAAPVKSQTGIAAAKPVTFGEEMAAKQAATNQSTVASSTVAGTTNSARNLTTTPANIEKLYKAVLNRASDTAGADYWTKKFGADISAAEVSEFIDAALPELKTKKTATTTTSGGGNDTITGGGGNDTITGGGGNDTITGGGGNNTVVDGGGNDTITGGGGNNTVVDGGGNDTITGGGSNITSDVMNLYNTILGRDPTTTGDQAGLDYWTKKFGDTLEASEVTEFAAAAADELKKKGTTTTTDGGGGFIGGSTWTDSAEYKSMQSQLATLQAAYDKLLAGQSGTLDGGIVTTGGLIDTGDGGASGVVYGPDGTMYSSAAAAIAAGVTNYTTTKPSIPGANTATAGDTQGFVIPSGQTGNTNPGGFISGAREQMFTMPTTAQLPGGIANPFIG